MVNSMGEFYDLEKKFNKTRDPNTTASVDGHCSGLVKLAPNNEDLFISQVTMSGFQNLLRVLKLYKFGYGKAVGMGGRRLLSHTCFNLRQFQTESSSPGTR